ncbi:hypothetical protein [Saccharibacillus endophyticus]|uniref:WD40 repeat domain-containing protein n=1 Tax=Saccharibacillus endophyticus TaxID=2060666 RepID=A0ABQ1ZWY8_9BACL|nr:hypothetical protein [Saccharibacillus endophyticus]GGH80050.1 hypothetical protein GCM10007362_27770 [Saccharibacillus endophyticus]
MRRTVKIAVTGTLMLALAAGVALADSAAWTRAGKEAGRQVAERGLRLEMPGRAEKQQAASSIDPATNRVEKRAGTAAAEAQTGTFAAKLALDGLNDTLTFRYVKSGDQINVLPSPDLGYELLALPDGRVLVEVAASIYRLDPEKRTLSVFLKGQTGTTRKTAVSGGSAKMAVWGQRASLSPDGTRLLYWTTRNITATRNEDGENWIKDLRTGAEKKIYGAGYTVLGWDARNRFYLDLGDRGIVQVDSESGASAKLVPGFSVSAVSGSHLLAQTTDGSLNVRNLSTGKQQAFRGGGLNHLRSIAASDAGPWFALVNAPDRSSRVSTLILLNAETLKSHAFEEPAGSSIIGVSWQDKQTLLVQTRNRTTAGESTYVIDIAKEVGR